MTTTKPAAPRTRPARPRPAPPRSRARTAAPRSAPRPAQPRAPRMPFVLLVLGLLAGALVSLLALRTVLLEDSFQISQLQSESTELGHTEEQLREEVVQLESSERIAREAEQLGMEPGTAPRFLHTEDGHVSGDGAE
ncbi:hypothetical protein [Nocardiopsis coralliicola]